MQMKKFSVTGMSCAACSARVEKAIMSVDGIDACAVNLITGEATVEGSAGENDIIDAIKKAGYGASVARRCCPLRHPPLCIWILGTDRQFLQFFECRTANLGCQ